ncbi:MAG: OmpH family outer membrane protein [Gemmatimonadetes bacterium]|nr:OmpH family outer membrane protein [Gemmatimonadota bacterium]
MVRSSSVRWLVLAFALVLAPVALQAQATAGRVAFINARAVLLATPGFTQAESTYTREVAGFRTEVERLQQSLDSAAADFEQRSVMLSAAAKTAKRRELETQRDQLQQRAQDLQGRAQQREQDLLSPIHNRVNAAIEAVRAAGGFALVFDVSANDGLIVAVDKTLDLTQQVIDKVKATP